MQLIRTENKEAICSQYRMLIETLFYATDENPSLSNQRALSIALLSHTRDIIAGKGEYALFHALVKTLVNVIDEHEEKKEIMYTIVKEMIKCCVILQGHQHPYGSWKDMKYLLNELKLPDSHPIFQFIIELYCCQLKIDEHSESKSLVCKWAPREKSKKFGWQTKYIARRYYPMFSEIKALIYYRKLITSLNKKIKTVQINQCNQTWSEIDFNLHVTSRTLFTQKRAFLKDINEDRTICHNHFLHYFANKPVKSARVSIHELVRECLRIPKQQLVHNYAIINLLNSQWDTGRTLTNPITNTIVLIDVSEEMFKNDSIYGAIALGLRIKELSRSNKIILYSCNAEEIDFENDTRLYDMVSRISKSSLLGLNSNIESALHLVKRISSHDSQRVIVMSEYSNERYKKIDSILDPNRYPTILWNMRSTTNQYKEGRHIISGFNQHAITQLSRGVGKQTINTLVKVSEQLCHCRYSWIWSVVDNV